MEKIEKTIKNSFVAFVYYMGESIKLKTKPTITRVHGDGSSFLLNTTIDVTGFVSDPDGYVLSSVIKNLDEKVFDFFSKEGFYVGGDGRLKKGEINSFIEKNDSYFYLKGCQFEYDFENDNLVITYGLDFEVYLDLK